MERECWECKRRTLPEDRMVAVDISHPDTYYPETVYICPSCYYG